MKTFLSSLRDYAQPRIASLSLPVRCRATPTGGAAARCLFYPRVAECVAMSALRVAWQAEKRKEAEELAKKLRVAFAKRFDAKMRKSAPLMQHCPSPLPSLQGAPLPNIVVPPPMDGKVLLQLAHSEPRLLAWLLARFQRLAFVSCCWRPNAATAFEVLIASASHPGLLAMYMFMCTLRLLLDAVQAVTLFRFILDTRAMELKNMMSDHDIQDQRYLLFLILSISPPLPHLHFSRGQY